MQQRFDRIGKQSDEDRAQQRAEQRAHAADDDHRDILDRQEQVKASTETKPR